MTAEDKRTALLRELCANDNQRGRAESPIVSLPSLDDPAARRRFARALAELIANGMLLPHGRTK